MESTSSKPSFPSDDPSAGGSGEEGGSPGLIYLVLLLLIIPAVVGIIFLVRYRRRQQFVNVARRVKLCRSPSNQRNCDMADYSSFGEPGCASARVVNGRCGSQTEVVEVLKTDIDNALNDINEGEFDPINEEMEKQRRRYIQRRTVVDDSTDDYDLEGEQEYDPYMELDETCLGDEENSNEDEASSPPRKISETPLKEGPTADIRQSKGTDKKKKKCDAVTARAWLRTLGGDEPVAEGTSGASPGEKPLDEGSCRARTPAAREEGTVEVPGEPEPGVERGMHGRRGNSALVDGNLKKVGNTLTSVDSSPDLGHAGGDRAAKVAPANAGDDSNERGRENYRRVISGKGAKNAGEQESVDAREEDEESWDEEDETGDEGREAAAEAAAKTKTKTCGVDECCRRELTADMGSESGVEGSAEDEEKVMKEGDGEGSECDLR
uniref:3'a2rel-related protein n=1 Tax=Trypanosoma congolense (strain IL3000) TaxID=1068625 RepID=G0UPS1_TRYCI|nr:conserved hypothetical protein [Trypanosoma congolense IL3000]